MSNIAKLTYLNETKRQLREAINAVAGGNLTQETPFREYARGWLRNQSASLTMDFSKQSYVAKDKAKVSMSHERVGFEDIVTVTRATGGGRFNAQGQYEWVGPDVPRIEYDPVTGECLGLLVEEQRTNLYRQNAILGQISGSGSTFTLIDGPNPEFGKFIHVAGAGSSVTPPMNISVQKGRSYILSAFSDKPTPLTAYLWGAAGGSYITTVVTPVGGGLYRHTRPVAVAPSNISSRPHFGDVSGHTLGWIQVEEGDFPTSYIPTEGAQVTRAADTVSVSELSPWYNSKQGSFSIKSKGHIGEPLLTAGDVSIIGDSDELKEYQVSYFGNPQATQVTMGKGLVESIRYWPREIA